MARRCRGNVGLLVVKDAERERERGFEGVENASKGCIARYH